MRAGIRCLVYLMLSLLAAVAWAGEQSYRIANSRSPDGKIELWINPGADEGESVGTAQIRDVKTGRIMDTFDWSGFGGRLVAPDPPFVVLWNPGSDYFAIKYEITRGWMTGAIYGRNGKGRWMEVKMPDDEYASAIEKMSGVKELYGKGCDVPKQWLKNGNLELLFVDRSLLYEHEDLEKEFMVDLKVKDLMGHPLKSAKIVSIKLKSEAEAEKDMEAQ